MALFIIGSLPITNSVSAEDEVDNWPENDAWLHIELISWSANETVEWDNNGGLPDPIFKICIEADGDNLDCINTPTWENQMTLNNSWNHSIDIPDHTNILNITIECEDNDAFNDDECDMNSDVNYWRLYAEYNWSATPTLTVSGNGDGDGNDTWKNAASTWKFTIDGFGDEDGDGVTDNLDFCPGTKTGEQLLNNTDLTGCSWNQWDLDGDGVISEYDSDPFDSRIGQVIGGSRNFLANENGLIPIENNGNSCDNSPSFVNIQIINNSDFIGLECHYINGDSWDSDEQKRTTQYDTNYLDFNKDGDNILASPHYNWVSVDTANGDRYSSLCYTNDNSFTGNILTKQISESGIILLHCIKETGHYSGTCVTSIYSLNESFANSVEIITFEYNASDREAMGGNRCTATTNDGPEGDVRQASHYGAFGDFDGNGVLDFVHNVDRSCELYFGISDEPFQFSSPQAVGPCWGGITAADVDNDGFDDIISAGGIIFMSDDGIELTTDSFYLGGNCGSRVILNHVYDYDRDGDLDVIFKISGERGSLYNVGDKFCTMVYENPWFSDLDEDGVPDRDDICPETLIESIVDAQGCSAAQKDTDNDSVTDNIDLCPSTNPSLDVDEYGCAEQQLDDDNDGINNAIDECPETPEDDLVNVRGCSFEDSQDLDSDNDGVLDSEDACPDTLAGITVDSIGCDLDGNQTPDTDSDGDGVYDSLDDCANTPFGATVDFTGCPMDSDSDGVYDGIDECPSSNNPSPSDMDKSSEVDSTGCFMDAAGSESDSDSAAFGCLGMIVMIGVVVFVVRKVRSPRQEQVFYGQTQPVMPVQQQFVPIPQVSSREKELEHQSRQAQIEAQRLRQQLANQAQITQQLQSEAAQKQMSETALAQKQHELAVAQQEKEELEAKLAEAEKNTPIVQHITYNIQDSAISGDITNKITRNDSE